MVTRNDWFVGIHAKDSDLFKKSIFPVKRTGGIICGKEHKLVSVRGLSQKEIKYFKQNINDYTLTKDNQYGRIYEQRDRLFRRSR